jgi:hypothetical protein
MTEKIEKTLPKFSLKLTNDDFYLRFFTKMEKLVEICEKTTFFVYVLMT